MQTELCGGLSYQRARITPYNVQRCKSHEQCDLDDKDADYKWDCRWCFLVNAHAEPLVSLHLALNYHEKYASRSQNLDSFLSRQGAAHLPPGPFLDHLCHGDSLNNNARATFAKYLPGIDQNMQLMAAFANQVFKREALHWVYIGKPCRDAIADAIVALRESDTPGFTSSAFKMFERQLFHDVSEAIDPFEELWECNRRRHSNGRRRYGVCKRWNNPRPTQGKQTVGFKLSLTKIPSPTGIPCVARPGDWTAATFKAESGACGNGETIH